MWLRARRRVSGGLLHLLLQPRLHRGEMSEEGEEGGDGGGAGRAPHQERHRAGGRAGGEAMLPPGLSSEGDGGHGTNSRLSAHRLWRSSS